MVVASGIASRHWSGMDDSCHSVHAIRLACCMRCHWLGMGDSRQVRHGAVDMRNYMCARGAFHCIIHQVTCDGSWNVLGAYPLVRYLQSIEDARGTRQWAPGGAKVDSTATTLKCLSTQ